MEKIFIQVTFETQAVIKKKSRKAEEPQKTTTRGRHTFFRKGEKLKFSVFSSFWV